MKYINTLYFLLFQFILQAQQNWNMELSALYNTVRVHNEDQLIKDGWKTIGLAISKETDGSKLWQQWHRYPQMGLLFRYKTFGNAAVMGSSYILLPYLEFTPFSYKKFALKIRHGTGLAFMNKIYNEEKNNENIFVSTHLNAATYLNVAFSYQVHKQWMILAGGDLSHESNGRLTVPNKGINAVSLYVGLRYRASQRVTARTKSDLPVVQKPWQAIINTAIGMSDYDFISRHMHFRPDIMATAAYQHSGRFRTFLGPGMVFQKYDTLNNRLYLCIGEEVLIGRISTKYAIGYYLDSYASRTFFKIGMCYYPFIPKNGNAKGFYIGSNLKAHKFIADFVELNVGYVF